MGNMPYSVLLDADAAVNKNNDKKRCELVFLTTNIQVTKT